MTDLLRFVSGPLPGAALPATYDGWLVALSYLVAALASYTAIDLADRVREFRAERRKAAAWLTGGAVAMGAGVWSMHFVAMLAYQLPVPVRYDWGTTLASMVVAMLTSGFALYIVTHYTLTLPRLALSGAVMGAGIGAMHYVGMAAMRLDALVMYYAGPFAISVVNAIACSTAALWLVARRADVGLNGRILAALVMGVAVAGMHYTGMYATVCVATSNTASVAGGLDASLLAVAITIITLLIMGMALAVSLQSQLLSRTLRQQNQLLLEEIAQKRRVEAELQAHRDNLQSLIDERTRELSKANHDIRESERRFRATFEHAAVGIAHTSLDGIYLLVNRKFCDMLGYNEPELIGNSAADQSHPEDRGSFGQQRQVMLSGQRDSVAEHKRYVRKDGSVLWTHRTVSLARGESGEPLYFIRVIEDITERMRAENAVAQERALLRTIIDSLPDLIIVKDTQGRIQLTNNSWLKDHAVTADDVVGKTIFDLFPPAAAQQIDDQDKVVMRTGVPVMNHEQPIFATAAHGTQGSQRWSFMTKAPMRDPSGNIVGTVGIMRETTQQKLMAQRREMEYAVTKVLAEAASAQVAMPKLIQIMCEATGWSCGAHWIKADGDDALVVSASWSDFAMDFDGDDQEHWHRAAGGDAQGLVGRTWRDRKPSWIANMKTSGAFARRDVALRFGLRSAFSFPVIAGDTAVGVMEFFGREVRQPDEMLLQTAGSIGQQVGQFIQRMQAENTVAQERALLRTIVDSLPDFIFVKDAGGRIQLANEAWLKDRSLASSDVTGKTVFDIFPRAVAENIAAQDAAVVRTGIPVINQEQSIAATAADGKPGPVRWGYMTKVPMRDTSGAISGTVGISRDITQQKLMTQRREMEYAITRLLAEAVSAEAAMPKLIQTMCEAAGWSYGAHWNRSDTGDALVVRERWSDFRMDFEETERQRWHRVTGRNANGLVSRAWYDKQPNWIEDMHINDSFARRDIALRFGLHSAFSFPVIAGDSAIGVMEFFGREVRQPDAMLLQTAGSIGQQVGQFLQRKRAESALQHAHAELEARVRDRTLDLEQLNTTLRSEIEQKRRVEAELQLHRDNLQSLIDERTEELEQSNHVLAQRTDEALRVTQMSNLLQTAGDMREAGEILSRMMRPLVAPHAGAIYLTAASLNRLDRLTCWGDTSYAAAIAPDECWGLRRGGVYGASNADHDMYCAHVHADAQQQPYLCVPMMAHGVSLGLLHISFAPDTNSAQEMDDERMRVQRIADQVTLALANVKLRQSLREQSIRDLLTGLFNRRYLEESLDREIARASREQAPLALIMLDVDHFKRFNDQYGHEGGDAVLQMLGRVLRDAARASDIVARYGGEEFTVLLPNASPDGARLWAERLGETVRGMQVQCGGKTFPPITVSLGLAMYGDHGMTGEQLVRAADIALYDAKRRGRNRLVIASTPTQDK